MIRVFPVWLTAQQQASEVHVEGDTCPHNRTRFVDSFDYARGDGLHEAQDILGPQGAAVLAVEPGFVTSYTSRDAGNGAVLWCPASGRRYLYTHLQRPANAPSAFPGRAVEAGELIGYLGKTGNAATTCPHLHFGVREIRRVEREPSVPVPNKWRAPDGTWWRAGEAINPYAELRAAPKVAPKGSSLWWLGALAVAGAAVGGYVLMRRLS